MKIQFLLASLAIATAYVMPINCEAQSRPVVYNPSAMLSGLSDNAAYAIGSTMGDEDVDNPHTAGGVWIDLATKSQIEISAPSGWAEVNDVADNGIVVGSAAGKPGYWDPETREWTTFRISPLWGGGTFISVTPDAHYAVGYLFSSNNEFQVSPLMYDLTKGENITPSNLPKYDLTGIDRKQNVLYGVSPDGRYLLGQISQSYLGDWDEEKGMMVPALFTYVYDRQDDTWQAIGYAHNADTKKFSPTVENLHYIQNQYMSCDGAWITGAAYMVRNGGEMEGGSEGFFPYRYDVAKGTLEVYGTDSDAGISGNKITSEGVVLGSSPYGNPYPTAMIRCGKYFISLDQIIQQVYGLTVPDLIHDAVTGAFESLSADGMTALMVTYDNSYIITMPESFVEAASKVDLLSNYTLNIPEGSKISRVSEVQITFDRVMDCMDLHENIKLLDGSGNVVRAASGLGVSKTNDHTIVVTFRSTALNPGETYTIDIPENIIWLKEDPSIKSKAIQIHYEGREAGPIQLLSVTPKDGSAVSQLNSNPDYISLTFDTPVALSSNARCALYNIDTDELITEMLGGVSGQQALFFPASEYTLYKGSKYKVVIDAGSVTDLSGGGGNEEVVLYYDGAYVRQLSADDIYIFDAKCDDYDNFMFWSGETNEPSAIPRSWGFTAESTWLLVRDNNESTDQALAAHSMFTTPAAADSWLITPQLYIPDANTYLAFDAQSYLRIRDDNLQVYIYTDDAVYNYFSAELRDVILTEGDKVFDEVVPAGASDEKLDGEWTHYIIPLDAYAGKNIYIAFAYRDFNKSAIFINDVQVVRNLSFLFTNQTPKAVVDSESVVVSGSVSSASELTTFKGINLQLINDNGDIIDEIEDPETTLAYGDTYKFTFSNPLPLTVGKETTYGVLVSSGAEASLYNFSVKDLAFEPVKRVVLEEYTGSQCGNCPLGIQAIENLQALYPDNFIAVTLRTYMNDMYANGATEYTNFLGLNAAPTGRINRGAVLAPMMQNGSNGYTFFGRGIVTSDGEEGYLWADAVQDELKVPAEADVTFSVTYDENSGQINIPCNVRFAIDREEASIAVFAVVIENKLPCYQLNYFNNVSDPNLGPWGAGGMYSQQTVTSWLANDVARFVVNGNSFNGTTLRESEFAAGTNYPITLSATIPTGRLTNPENCKVVAMVIDRSTGAIINACEEALKVSGITDIVTDEDSDIEYYDLQGMKVTNPQKGSIYIQVNGNHVTKIRL